MKEAILFSTVICLTTNLPPSDDCITLPNLFDHCMCISRSTAGCVCFSADPRQSPESAHRVMHCCFLALTPLSSLLCFVQYTALSLQGAGLSCSTCIQISAQASSTLKCEKLLCLLAVNSWTRMNHSKPGNIPCCCLKITSKQ